MTNEAQDFADNSVFEDFEDTEDLEHSRPFDGSSESEDLEDMQLSDPYATTKMNTWDFRGRLSPFEGEKEFEMFSLYRDSGSGRSITYISKVFNLQETRLQKIAARDSWGKRAADFDKYNLQLMLKQESNQRALEHKAKLEEYRQTQEYLGRALTSNAAKIAAITNRALDKFIAAEGEIELRDIPGILSAASKAAELGRNLQASSLGVDQLLAALEEMDE